MDGWLGSREDPMWITVNCIFINQKHVSGDLNLMQAQDSTKNIPSEHAAGVTESE